MKNQKASGNEGFLFFTPEKNSSEKPQITFEKVGGFDRLIKTSVCGQGYCGGKNEQVTTYTYWNHTALPLTVTKTNGLESKSLTTTYDYDTAGRQLMEDGPLPGTAEKNRPPTF